jgi:hypothetical protein
MTKPAPELLADGIPGNILQYDQDGLLRSVTLSNASFDLDTLPVIQTYTDTDIMLMSIGGVESAISALDFKIALEDIVIPTPPIGPGELVQYSDPTQKTAPTNVFVNAYSVQLQDAASVRLQFRIFDTGSNPQWRSTEAYLSINGVNQGRMATTGSGSSLLVNYDVLGLNPGDILLVRIRVANADQAPYIDANIEDFFVKTDAPLPNPIIQII